jgi:hypothetical protein
MPFVYHRLGASDVPEHLVQPPHDGLRVLAEATQPHIARTIQEALITLRNEITPRFMYRAMTSGHGVGYALGEAVDKFKDDLSAAKIFLANIHLQAGAVMEHRLGLNVRKDTINFDLGALPQPTQDALQDYDYGLVTDVSDDVRQSISNVITRGIQSGWSPDKMARELRSAIGLTSDQYNAVSNYRSLLESGSSDALDRQLRDATFDDTVQASVDGVSKLTPDQVERFTNRYADRYLAYRANTIARYESLRASNQGGYDSVQSAIDAGVISPEDVTTNWMIANDEITCPRCRSVIDIQPDGVPFGTFFTWAAGKRTGQIALAPLHPDCRCTNTYKVVRSALEAA